MVTERAREESQGSRISEIISGTEEDGDAIWREYDGWKAKNTCWCIKRQTRHDIRDTKAQGKRSAETTGTGA